MRIKRNFWRKFSPLMWSQRQIKVSTIVFFAIALPAFIIGGLQPTPTAVASVYPELIISELNLETPVEPIELTETNELIAPATIPGSFSTNDMTTLLIGHSSTIFESLNQLSIGAEITYAEQTYAISKIETVAKENINMRKLLEPDASGAEILVIMTCAGESLGGGDYTERLIITATR